MIIDFRKIEVTDLEGNKSTFDVRKELGNTIYNSYQQEIYHLSLLLQVKHSAIILMIARS